MGHKAELGSIVLLYVLFIVNFNLHSDLVILLDKVLFFFVVDLIFSINFIWTHLNSTLLHLLLHIKDSSLEIVAGKVCYFFKLYIITILKIKTFFPGQILNSSVILLINSQIKKSNRHFDNNYFPTVYLIVKIQNPVFKFSMHFLDYPIILKFF